MRSLMRALMATLCLMTFACSAQDGEAGSAKTFKEGEHFKKVKTVAKPEDAKRIKVEEFFWYGCGHCFNFEPEISAWVKRKPSDVDFIRVPSSLGRPEGVIHQKTYYTAEALGLTDKIHPAFFAAIHNKHQPLFTQKAIGAYFNAHSGVLPDIFDSTFSSFAVDSRVRRATALAKDYQIFSVPSVVVGGKYQSTAEMAGGTFKDLTQVIDFLIEKIRKERQG